jgi:3-hydroxybutyryl-CoA dehydrogenase
VTRPAITVSVIGLGTTGSALTALLAASGFLVDTVERDPEALWRGRLRVKEAVTALGMSDVDTAAARGRVNYTTGTTLLPRADVVVEAVPEELSGKVALLRRADALCPPHTVFVTTTTGLSVTEIASRTGRMSRTVGLHLCHPDRVTGGPSVEVVHTPVTDAEVRREMRELVSGLGKTAVCVADHPGQLGAGLLLGYLNRAAAMYEQRHASRDDIDAAMTRGCGLPLGPLAQLDAMGLDVVLDSLRALAARTGDSWYTPATVLHRMVDAGLLGRKSGQGFYRYDSTDDEPETAGCGRPVTRVGVAGSGTMAAGIAEVFARAGYSTTVAARTDTRAKTALSAVEASMTGAVLRHELDDAELDRAMARLSHAGDLAALGDCELVVEAVAEDVAVKQGVLTELGARTRPGTVLATTTSSLPLVRLAAATGRPESVLGMHFLNPAPVVDVVEVAPTALTADEVVATALAVTRSLGKRAVRCRDRAGFVVNALLFPYLNRAVRLARERNVDFDTIDTVLTGGYGFPTGPFRLLDTIGLDVSLAIQQRLHDSTGEAGLAPARYLSDLVAAGCVGRGTGRGFLPA